VTEGGELRGIVSDRDIKMALGMNGVDPDKTKVKDVAFEDPYLISPGSKLDEVVAAMAEKKIGSALVVDHNKLVGIFTTTDALKALNELLHSRLTH
jgi:acetoin utilization protein AcuB